MKIELVCTFSILILPTFFNFVDQKRWFSANELQTNPVIHKDRKLIDEDKFLFGKGYQLHSKNTRSIISLKTFFCLKSK